MRWTVNEWSNYKFYVIRRTELQGALSEMVRDKLQTHRIRGNSQVANVANVLELL